MARRKTSVAIDEDLLAAVPELLQNRTVKDTIEQAFLELLRVKARKEEVAALSTMSGMELDADRVMSRVWRQ